MNEIIEILNLVRATSSTNNKLGILEQYKHNQTLLMVLEYTYNPYKKYGISQKTLDSMDLGDDKIVDNQFSNIFNMLEYLIQNNASNKTRGVVESFLSDFKDAESELYQMMITKDLMLGINVTSINKVFKDLIPVFEVQNAHPYEKYPLKQGEWFSLSIKENGIRGVLFDGKFITRQGHEIMGLDHIISAIEEHYVSKLRNYELNDLVFDGELVYANDDVVDENDRFRRSTSILNSDEPNKTNIKFVIFALVDRVDFIKGESKYRHKEMVQLLADIDREICSKFFVPFDIVQELYHGTDQTKIDELLKEVTDKGLEGLMLNKDVPYKCKRHTGILKVKQFFNMDLEITGYKEGTKRLAGSLGSFTVDFNGNSVDVGSGYTDEQRKELWENRDSYIGRVLELKYKEVSENKKTGAQSLQFPTFVCIREEGKEVSYG